MKINNERVRMDIMPMVDGQPLMGVQSFEYDKKRAHATIEMVVLTKSAYEFVERVMTEEDYSGVLSGLVVGTNKAVPLFKNKVRFSVTKFKCTAKNTPNAEFPTYTIEVN